MSIASISQNASKKLSKSYKEEEENEEEEVYEEEELEAGYCPLCEEEVDDLVRIPPFIICEGCYETLRAYFLKVLGISKEEENSGDEICEST